MYFEGNICLHTFDFLYQVFQKVDTFSSKYNLLQSNRQVPCMSLGSFKSSLLFNSDITYGSTPITVHCSDNVISPSLPHCTQVSPFRDSLLAYVVTGHSLYINSINSQFSDCINHSLFVQHRTHGHMSTCEIIPT